MKLFVLSTLTLCAALSACSTVQRNADTAPTLSDKNAVSPALSHYTNDVVIGDLWKRPDLSPRDRSVVTLSVLIALNQTVELPYHLNLALDNGVKPGEISEIITHLAFYSGWANATSAVGITKAVFEKRGIAADQIPPVAGDRLPIDEAAEARRANGVQQNFGKIAPGVAQFSTNVCSAICGCVRDSRPATEVL